MTNERLRAAFTRAGLTPELVSGQLGVDPKTVQKWLAGRTPHRRHRWAVCELVDESEQYLWPDASRVSGDGYGSNEEILQAFPRRAAVEPSRWRACRITKKSSPSRACDFRPPCDRMGLG